MVRGSGIPSPTAVAHQLKGIDFPASKDDLIEQALDNGVPGEVAELLEEMPDRDYDNMADVMDAYSDVRQHFKGANGGGVVDEDDDEDELLLDQVYQGAEYDEADLHDEEDEDAAGDEDDEDEDGKT